MKRWASLTCLASLATLALSNEILLKQDEGHNQRCSGMYSRKAWGGDVAPFILVRFSKDETPDDSDPLTSLIIFEWQDEDLIGVYPPGADAYTKKELICDSQNVANGFCKEEDIGSFILAPNATELSHNLISNQAIHLKDPDVIKYDITKTGYYCVITNDYSNHEYNAVVVFRNAYGELPAAQIAKLPFYGGLAIAYALMGIFWAMLYFLHRHDILAVQNYITATLVFLIVEELMTWGYYDYQNRHGNNLGNKAFMIIVSILNAGRNSLSFFLLLIVCMGYGVVKHTLGKTMTYVRILAITHFVFGVIYAIASLSITPDTAGPLVLLVILPLSATLTAFYVWTLSSLNLTMKDLAERKQKTKFMMYKKLWWCILGSIMVIFGFFFINSISLAGTYNDDFVPTHWQTRWFVLDGWLNLVYFFDIAFVAYLWRPTANNRRFAMSDELAQDDDGFEIRSIAGDLSDDDDDPDHERRYDDPEAAAQRKLHENAAQPSGGASTSISDAMPSTDTTKNKAPERLRESLDGETIFAVGDDGIEWSDGSDDDADEGRKLTKKI